MNYEKGEDAIIFISIFLKALSAYAVGNQILVINLAPVAYFIGKGGLINKRPHKILYLTALAAD